MVELWFVLGRKKKSHKLMWLGKIPVTLQLILWGNNDKTEWYPTSLNCMLIAVVVVCNSELLISRNIRVDAYDGPSQTRLLDCSCCAVHVVPL